MPTIRKLAPEEVDSQKRKKMSQRQITAREYDSMVADFAIGDWGELTLAQNDNRLTVRSRLQSAAERRGVSLAFQRSQGGAVRFEVLPAAPKQDELLQVAPTESSNGTVAPSPAQPGRGGAKRR